MSGNTITILGAGNCTVTASQNGNGNYNSAIPVSRSFNVLGPQDIEADVLNRLKALRQSIVDKQEGHKLDEAISRLTAAVDSSLWMDQQHPAAKDG